MCFSSAKTEKFHKKKGERGRKIQFYLPYMKSRYLKTFSNSFSEFSERSYDRITIFFADFSPCKRRKCSKNPFFYFLDEQKGFLNNLIIQPILLHFHGWEASDPCVNYCKLRSLGQIYKIWFVQNVFKSNFCTL